MAFSGGKDSTVLLHKLIPWRHLVTVYWANPGAPFPHVEEFIRSTCTKWGFELKIVQPPVSVQNHIATNGLPVDMLPVDYTFMDRPVKLQGYTACCGPMFWYPLHDAMLADGHTIIVKGTKKSDRRRSPIEPGTIHNGIQYLMPLWDMTDQDIMAYVKIHGIELPEQYPEVNDSLDCWLCTAHIASGGLAKFKYMQRRYPELWKQLAPRIKAVQSAIYDELSHIAEALDEGSNHG